MSLTTECWQLGSSTGKALFCHEKKLHCQLNEFRGIRFCDKNVILFIYFPENNQSIPSTKQYDSEKGAVLDSTLLHWVT